MPTHYPKSIESLIKQFSQLPSVGRKTAERYVFYLLKQKPEQIKLFSRYLNELPDSYKVCQKCLALSEENPCSICSDKNRQDNIICIVSNFQDLLAIENTKKYNGKYFILGGLINPVDDIGPEKLNIKLLVKEINQKLKSQNNIEIILALSPTMEGETTSLYLQKILNNAKIKITKLARGLSTGISLEYADENTLANALNFRKIV